jgi:hypothetical protein
MWQTIVNILGEEDKGEEEGEVMVGGEVKGEVKGEEGADHE